METRVSTVRYTLRKSEIIRGKKNLEEIFSYGKRIKGKFLQAVVHVKSQPGESGRNVLVGFFARRSVKRAVDRNRVKRLMRESYRLNKHQILSSAEKLSGRVEIVFMFPPTQATPACPIPTFAQVESDVKQILTTVSEGNF